MSLKLTSVSVFPAAGNKINIGYGTATFNEGMQVRFNIRKSHAGSEFVSWPQSSYVKDGKTVYTNEVTILKEVSDDINTQIITEFNKALAISPKDDDQTSTTTDTSATTTAVTVNTKSKAKPKVKNNW
jgi:hypothetical protein